ncbi:MAG: hypothetical protein AAFR81_25160 [Chloroflexota bacterium]
MKKKSPYAYIFDESPDLLRTRDASKAIRAEIIHNLHRRYGVPQVKYKATFILGSLTQIIIYIVLDGMAFLLVLSAYALDVTPLVALGTGITVALSAAIAYLADRIWRVISTPDDHFENLCDKVFQDGTVVPARLVDISYRQQYQRLVYSVHDSEHTYEYVTVRDVHTRVGASIPVLFINDNLHIPL